MRLCPLKCNKKLEALLELHQKCDFTMKSLEIRQAARNEKMKTVDEKKATEVKISSTSKTITMS